MGWVVVLTFLAGAVERREEEVQKEMLGVVREEYVELTAKKG